MLSAHYCVNSSTLVRYHFLELDVTMVVSPLFVFRVNHFLRNTFVLWLCRLLGEREFVAWLRSPLNAIQNVHYNNVSYRS